MNRMKNEDAPIIVNGQNIKFESEDMIHHYINIQECILIIFNKNYELQYLNSSLVSPIYNQKYIKLKKDVQRKIIKEKD